MKKKGFSLIELFIVLLILGLSISLVAPSLSKLFNTIEFKTTVQKISSLLRYYRSEAINKGRIYRVIFDLDEAVLKIKSLDSEETISYPLPKGILIKEINPNLIVDSSEKPTIEFYPNGGSNGGSILLNKDNREFKIFIHPLTGMVMIQSIKG
jgi:general secretion pathway protein H